MVNTFLLYSSHTVKVWASWDPLRRKSTIWQIGNSLSLPPDNKGKAAIYLNEESICIGIINASVEKEGREIPGGNN